MKSKHFALPALLLALTAPTLAQSPAHDHESSTETSSPDAVKAFDRLKTLAGSWVGRLTTTPKVPAVDGTFVQFSMRVGSLGHSLIHEASVSGLPDHPVTMFYVDGERLTLTHYCDAGNRPRMVGTVSPDGKTLEFEFLDLSGGKEKGHMHHAVFTFIDENHHTEEWTYMMPGDQPMRARFDLERTNFQPAATH
jgi:hypothetical protein